MIVCFLSNLLPLSMVLKSHLLHFLCAKVWSISNWHLSKNEKKKKFEWWSQHLDWAFMLNCVTSVYVLNVQHHFLVAWLITVQSGWVQHWDHVKYFRSIYLFIFLQTFAVWPSSKRFGLDSRLRRTKGESMGVQLMAALWLKTANYGNEQCRNYIP